jgi:integrase
MANPKRRGGIYYANVQLNGVRLRECLNTGVWAEALRRQRELVRKTEAGQINAQSARNREWLRCTLTEALDALLAERTKEQKAEETLMSDRNRSKQVKRLIGAVLVRRVTADTIEQYQSTRQSEGVSGRTINMEVTLIRLILKRANRWGRMAEEVKKFPESHDIVGRVLAQDEKRRLFEKAASKEGWVRALFCAIIAVNTTGRKIEVLRSRLRDVDFFNRIWSIPKSKTKAGVRRIDLNEEALHAFAHMKRIVEQLGGGAPEHYFFPACECKRYDFTHHQKSVRTAWRKLTTEAGLKGFRIHDLRHQCLTEMAENDVPPDVMMSLAGHLSEKMRQHYIHVRDQAKKKAVAGLPGTGLLRLSGPESVSRKQ